jgi:hypothetical protein
MKKAAYVNQPDEQFLFFATNITGTVPTALNRPGGD